jgi:hypothetical protein
MANLARYQEPDPLVTANTRYQRKSFVKRVERLEDQSDCIDRVDGDIDRSASAAAQVLLIVLASVTVFYPWPRPGSCDVHQRQKLTLKRRNLGLLGFAVRSQELDELVALSKDIGSSCARQALKRFDRQSC